jgi:hypothetical protein
MIKCIQCGVDYTPRNSGHKYCSGACKSRASRERHKNNLSDLPNNSLRQIPATSVIVSDMADAVVKGAMGQLHIPSVIEVVKTLKDSSVSKTNKFLLVGSGLAGGIAGYQFAGEGRRLGGIILGSFLGIGVGKIIHWLFQSGEPISVSPNLSDLPFQSYELYTSEEISRLDISTISFGVNTALCQLVGHTFNDRFSLLLYGVAGGGKSHLATWVASELGMFGRVLYVLTEEEITDSVKQRVIRYKCNDNVKFFVCNNEEHILEEVSRGYNFLILDSLNGMSQWNYHTDFLRRVKSLSLRGVVLLNQCNKCGDVVGNNSLKHEVDVEIRVTDCIAETVKNRFGISGNRLVIYEKPPIVKQIS